MAMNPSDLDRTGRVEVMNRSSSCEPPRIVSTLAISLTSDRRGPDDDAICFR